MAMVHGHHVTCRKNRQLERACFEGRIHDLATKDDAVKTKKIGMLRGRGPIAFVSWLLLASASSAGPQTAKKTGKKAMQDAIVRASLPHNEVPVQKAPVPCDVNDASMELVYRWADLHACDGGLGRAWARNGFMLAPCDSPRHLVAAPSLPAHHMHRTCPPSRN